MAFTNETSDTAILMELGARLERYRLNRNQTQALVAHEAGVSERTIIRMEHGESVQLTSLIRVLRVHGLLQNIDALVPAPPVSPVQLVRMQGKERQRASSPSAPSHGSDEAAEPWTWGDDR